MDSDTPTSHRSHPWLGEAAAVLCLLAVVALPRVLTLAADPPPDVADDFVRDEGLWLHNARLYALFGRWIIDEQVAGAYGAPLYTGVLAAVYRLFGVGLVPTHAVAAGSGALACLVLYAAIRARHPRRVALLAALVMGAGYFSLTRTRLGMPESFQLLPATAAAMATYLAVERRQWAFWAGVLFVLAVLAKTSALLLVPVVAVFWLLLWLRARRGIDTAGWSRAGVLWWLAGAAAASVVVALVLIAPNWEGFRGQLLLNAGNALAETADRPAAGLLGIPRLRLSFNTFWSQSAVPIATILLLGISRLAAAERSPASRLEVFAWAWLVAGVGFIAVQAGQPDRRFLLLVPPMAVLFGTVLERGGVALPCRFGSRGVWSRLACGGLLGAGLGLYWHQALDPWVRSAIAGATDRTVGPRDASALLVTGLVVAGAVVAATCWRWLPRRSFRVPSLLIGAAFLLTEPGRWLFHALQPTYTIRDTARAVGTLTRGWDRADKVLVGRGVALLFALESDLFAFPIRLRSGAARRELVNADGWTRFRPAAAATGQPVGRNPYWTESELGARGLVPTGEWGFWPDWDGRPQWQLRLFVRADLCASCQRPP